MTTVHDPKGRDSGQMLGVPELRRLLLGLIADFQTAMIREGRLSPTASIAAVSTGLGVSEVDELMVDEGTLGLDSLATIELVTKLNVFFGLDATGVEDFLLVRRQFGDWLELIDHHFAVLGPSASIVFQTSGSTAEPKRIRQSFVALDSEVTGLLAGPLKTVQAARVLCAVPVTHIYGFIWGVLLPKRLRVDAVDLPTGLPGAMLRTACPGDLVLATPFTWDRTASCAAKFAPHVVGVCSAGPTTAETWRVARDCGLARMIEVYGSSETGGVGWRSDENNAFELMPDIKAIGSGSPRLERAGFAELDVQDHLEWIGSSDFHVRGRRDPVVQVAGTNVNLHELRALIEAEPDVLEAAVRLDGDRLKAFVVQAHDAAPDIEGRLRRVMARLPAPARPERFSFGTALPRTPTGKLADW